MHLCYENPIPKSADTWGILFVVYHYSSFIPQKSLTMHEKQVVEKGGQKEQRLLCEQGQLRIDVVDLSRLAQIKTDEREQKARDFLKAELRYHKAIEDLKTKELSIQDNAKKLTEVQRRFAILNFQNK